MRIVIIFVTLPAIYFGKRFLRFFSSSSNQIINFHCYQKWYFLGGGIKYQMSEQLNIDRG